MTCLGFDLWEGLSLRTVRGGADKPCVPYMELPLAGPYGRLLYMKSHHRVQSKFWQGNRHSPRPLAELPMSQSESLLSDSLMLGPWVRRMGNPKEGEEHEQVGQSGSGTLGQICSM